MCVCFSKANPSDCVDMDCDAKKKTLLQDQDGSFLGAVGSVVPQSEYEWGGDPRRGVGDYRIPTVMLTATNGSRIPVEQVAPHKGEKTRSCRASWFAREPQLFTVWSLNPVAVLSLVLRCDPGELHLHEVLAGLQVFRPELQDVGHRESGLGHGDQTSVSCRGARRRLRGPDQR